MVGFNDPQIDVVLLNVIKVLMIAQGASLLKQMFDGTYISISFSAMNFCGTLFYFFTLSNRPIITPTKFPDEPRTINAQSIEKWFNNYKHPLCVTDRIRSVPKSEYDLGMLKPLALKTGLTSVSRTTLTSGDTQVNNTGLSLNLPILDFMISTGLKDYIEKFHTKKSNFMTNEELEEMYEQYINTYQDQNSARRNREYN